MDNLIVVTGYGAFKGHEELNASWEAVKLLPNEVRVEETNFQLRKWPVAVEYGEVDKTIQLLWKQKPFLVVHCGIKVKEEYCQQILTIL